MWSRNSEFPSLSPLPSQTTLKTSLACLLFVLALAKKISLFFPVNLLVPLDSSTIESNFLEAAALEEALRPKAPAATTLS